MQLQIRLYIFSTSSLHLILLYQHRQLQQTVRSLSGDASKTLVQAFVSCLLDYCNHLFFGISEGLMTRLQSPLVWLLELDVHNAVAQSATLATGTPARRLQCCDYCASVAVWHLTIVQYLADDCRLVADARERRLRSTASQTCVVTQTYSTFGDKAFCSC